MGIVRMGPPKDIILYLKDLCRINFFIETGTFHGWTSYWASKHFREVKTIEFSKNIYQETKNKFQDLSNVEFIYGDSREELNKLVKTLYEPVIFWLDAHWCNLDSYGENDQCPLLAELEIIDKSKYENVILIDDARLFLSPPPKPNVMNFYPDISQVITSLTSNLERYVLVYEDVIIAIPLKYKELFAGYMQLKSTETHKTHAIQIRKRDKIRKYKRLMKKIIGYKYFFK